MTRLYQRHIAYDRGVCDGKLGLEKHEARKRMFDDARRYYNGAENDCGASYDQGYEEGLELKGKEPGQGQHCTCDRQEGRAITCPVHYPKCPPTVQDLVSWLEAQDPKTKYNSFSTTDCLLCRFASEVLNRNVDYLDARELLSDYAFVQISLPDADISKQTYAFALERARKLVTSNFY